MEACRLYEANDLESWCTRKHCIYWRLLESQDVSVSNKIGCGLEHHGLMEGISSQTAKWLLSMKKRLEDTTPEIGKARIIFRRRERK